MIRTAAATAPAMAARERDRGRSRPVIACFPAVTGAGPGRADPGSDGSVSPAFVGSRYPGGRAASVGGPPDGAGRRWGRAAGGACPDTAAGPACMATSVGCRSGTDGAAAGRRRAPRRWPEGLPRRSGQRGGAGPELRQPARVRRILGPQAARLPQRRGEIEAVGVTVVRGLRQRLCHHLIDGGGQVRAARGERGRRLGDLRPEDGQALITLERRRPAEHLERAAGQRVQVVRPSTGRPSICSGAT